MKVGVVELQVQLDGLSCPDAERGFELDLRRESLGYEMEEVIDRPELRIDVQDPDPRFLGRFLELLSEIRPGRIAGPGPPDLTGVVDDGEIQAALNRGHRLLPLVRWRVSALAEESQSHDFLPALAALGLLPDVVVGGGRVPHQGAARLVFPPGFDEPGNLRVARIGDRAALDPLSLPDEGDPLARLDFEGDLDLHRVLRADPDTRLDLEAGHAEVIADERRVTRIPKLAVFERDAVENQGMPERLGSLSVRSGGGDERLDHGSPPLRSERGCLPGRAKPMPGLFPRETSPFLTVSPCRPLVSSCRSGGVVPVRPGMSPPAPGIRISL